MAHQQQITKAGDSGQKIVEVVGNAARQLAHRLHFLRLRELQFQILLLGHVHHVGNEPFFLVTERLYEQLALTVRQVAQPHIHRRRRVAQGGGTDAIRHFRRVAIGENIGQRQTLIIFVGRQQLSEQLVVVMEPPFLIQNGDGQRRLGEVAVKAFFFQNRSRLWIKA
jgi:hypothetical protein